MWLGAERVTENVQRLIDTELRDIYFETCYNQKHVKEEEKVGC